MTANRAATRTSVKAIAYSLPATLVTNDDLRREHPEWEFERLEKRAGVFNRYIAAERETALDFAVRACEQLEMQGELRKDEIDALIFCTQSPDYIMPPNSCILHGRLG